MNKQTILTFFKDIQNILSKHSPEILTGVGIAGMISTTILAVKATPKAIRLIEDEKQNRIGDATLEEAEVISTADGIKIPPIDCVKLCWKMYIPAVATGILSSACLIGAQSVNARRTAAIATAYKLSETALEEYKEKVIETVGEKVDKEVKNKIAKDKVDNNPVDTSNVIITGNGKTLCLDGLYGQYFESDIEHIKKAVNILNYNMIHDQYASLNDFYDELGIDSITIGDDVGWNISKDGLLDVTFSTQIAKDGRPCLVLQYTVSPRYDYYKGV